MPYPSQRTQAIDPNPQAAVSSHVPNDSLVNRNAKSSPITQDDHSPFTLPHSSHNYILSRTEHRYPVQGQTHLFLNSSAHLSSVRSDKVQYLDPSADLGPPLPKRLGFRRVHTIHNLQSHASGRLDNRQVTADGAYLSPLRRLTTHLVQTYHICNLQFVYEPTQNPRRVLTKPGKPVYNHGYDNEDSDYILCVNDWLGTESGRKYLILDMLGKGSYGQVVKCRDLETQETVSVKIIKNKPVSFGQSMMEVAVLELLNKQFDPNDKHHILRLRDSFIHKNHHCLVFEPLSRSLSEVIKQSRFQGLSMQLIRDFVTQLLDALTVFKEAQLIHCDIKPENILLKSAQSTQIKVTSFGSSHYDRQAIHSYIQSHPYRSPEVLLGMSYTSAIDMWSLGCVAVELYRGLPLFPGTNEFDQLTGIVDLLGMPPLSMLNTGKYVSRFFDSYTAWNPHSNEYERRFKLKIMKQHSSERGIEERLKEQHFRATTLSGFINIMPVTQLESLESSRDKVERDLTDRAAFIDFCQGLLNLDPSTRWTPQKARIHPFITGEKFTKSLLDGPVVSTYPLNTSVCEPAYNGLVTLQQKGPDIYQAAHNPKPAQHQTYTTRPQIALPSVFGPHQRQHQSLPLPHETAQLTNNAKLGPVVGQYVSGAPTAGLYHLGPQAHRSLVSDPKMYSAPIAKSARSPGMSKDILHRNALTPVLHREKWQQRPRNPIMSSTVEDSMRTKLHGEVLQNQAIFDLGLRSLFYAGLHSVGRFPPPRCHPGTRMKLKEEIHTWLMDENREQDMLWLYGPAGVGKSAMAQTVGELAEELEIFGAAVFFSQSRKVDSSSLLVTSIAFQLTNQHPSYKNIVADIIRKEPAILNIDKRTQLRKLLVEPFAALPSINKQLVIIDGLDECGGETEQSKLVRLIAEVVEDPDSPPFLWLICSRPEHHLKELFLGRDLSDICWRRDLLPQEPGADADVEMFLIDGLQRIAERFHDQDYTDSLSSLTTDSEILSRLVRTVSGVFVVASSMLAFIGDPIIGKPASQLQTVLDAIDGSTDGSGQSFLAPIDALYIGVLRAVEKTSLPQTLRILGACAVSPRMPALHLANLLGVTQEAFYSSLRSLHAFLSVPHHTTAGQESLHYFHASFPDFLLHHSRSGEYFQDSDAHRFKLARACFRALNSTCTTYIDNLSWLPPDPGQYEDDTVSTESPLSVSHDILSLATMHVWDLCTRISKPQEWKPLLKIVANFDFGRLQPFSDALPVQPFIHFIRWVHKWGKQVLQSTDIVRTRCSLNVDVLLLEKCSTVSQPLSLESAGDVNELEESPRYAFVGLGLGAKTVVVLLVPEAVMIYSIKDIDSL